MDRAPSKSGHDQSVRRYMVVHVKRIKAPCVVCCSHCWKQLHPNTCEAYRTDSHVCDRSFPKTRHAFPPTRWVVTIHFGSCHGPLVRNRYNQAPHLTQDTNGKVTNSQLDITNESQEVSPFTAGDHKAPINRRA